MTSTIAGTDRALMQRRTALGVEFGSTRIKAVLIGPDHQPIATAGHSWDNQYVDGWWTYSLDAVWDGLRHCFATLAEECPRPVRDPADRSRRTRRVGDDAWLPGLR